MSMIRGKLTAPREIVPKINMVGDSRFRKCLCGCDRWYNKHTGVEAKVSEFTEAFEVAKHYDHNVAGRN